MLTFRDRIEGGLWGLLIGDALGVPYEFKPPTQLPPLATIEMTPPPGFPRSHGNVPPGTWSDDGAQALALLASLVEKGKLDIDDYGQKLLAWFEHGYMAVDNRVFDVGNQTRTALHKLRAGASARGAGGQGERDNGNGSLMRVLPLALWHQGSDASLVDDAALQSLVTHAHVRSQVCCALYCLWARRLLADVPDGWTDAVATLRALYAAKPAELHELDNIICPDEPPTGAGSGYVVDSLHSARLVLSAGDYEQVVKAAVALGHDTDTTACIAGGIAGIRDGVVAIPQRWMDQLRGKELVQPLLDQLLAHLTSKRARRADWQILPMPAQTAIVDYTAEFSAEEYQLLSQGLIPESMDDRWFIFCEQNMLFLHRSWTGICVFQVELEAVGSRYRVKSVTVNRDQEQYNQADAEYDSRLLHDLIYRVLLRPGRQTAVAVATAPSHVEKPIHFYQVDKPYGFFSNFSPHAIYLKGKSWPTVEHYFQAQKFAGTQVEEQVRLASSPMEAARMGRNRQHPLRPDWEAIKEEFMYEALLTKFTQHPDLRQRLLATGEAELVEHTSNDRYWADGGDGSGKNRLGQLLMKVRTALREQHSLRSH
jgi:ribA/ribD-fused uncharacterized protein